MAPTNAAAFPAEAVMKIATGFMGSKYLFVGVELRVFEHLARGPLSLDALADRTKAPTRTLRIVVDALVALGLLSKGPNGYGNSTAAQSLLAGVGSRDLRPALRLYNRISYPNWMDLEHSVNTGTPARTTLDAENQQLLSTGVDALSASAAATLPFVYDFAKHRRLLDVGGGTGSFLIAALQRYPHLTGTLVDTKAVAALAHERLTAVGLSARAEAAAGDILETALPAGHDAVLIANVLHLMAPDKNRELLRRARGCIGAGGCLLLVDFFTDPTHTEPLFATLMAGSFLTGYGEGDVYSEEEVGRWLFETGWRPEPSRELAGAARLIVATPV